MDNEIQSLTREKNAHRVGILQLGLFRIDAVNLNEVDIFLLKYQ